MGKIILAFMVIASTYAYGRDVPFEFVTTKDDLGLKGKPKVMLLEVWGRSVEHKFNKDGVLVRRRNNVDGKSRELKIDDGRIVKIAEYSGAEHGDSYGGVFFRPLRYDEKKRIVAISEDRISDGMPKVISPEGVWVFYYDGLQQIHEWYVNRKLISRKVYVTNESGSLKQVYSERQGSDGKYYRTGPGDEYGEFGPLVLRYGTCDSPVGGGYTKYQYEDGMLVSRIYTDECNKKVIAEYYGNYQNDGCGNWTSRVKYDTAQDGGKSSRPLGIEVRKIDYFEDCK